MKRKRPTSPVNARSTPTSTPLSTSTTTRSTTATTTPRELYFDDPDEEIIFSIQADKRRKMTEQDEMKLWISKELKEAIAPLATHVQVKNIAKMSEQNRA